MRNWDTLPIILYRYDVEIFLVSLYVLMIAMFDPVLGIPGAMGFSLYLVKRRKRKG